MSVLPIWMWPLSKDPALAEVERACVLTCPRTVTRELLDGPAASAAWFPGVCRNHSNQMLLPASRDRGLTGLGVLRYD